MQRADIKPHARAPPRENVQIPVQHNKAPAYVMYAGAQLVKKVQINFFDCASPAEHFEVFKML
ncbi:MAG: hypothetical protein Q4E20_06820, partial [Eubacteriales bacterium]|nr:hypothetical protein [Eubacteriales bacterium]